MRWLRRLFTRSPRQQPDTALWLYVQCDRCGEALSVRADRRYDLASEMRDPGEAGPAYVMHKDIVGDRCFQRIAVTLGFDGRLRIVERQIRGGQFLSEEAYQAALKPGAQPEQDG